MLLLEFDIHMYSNSRSDSVCLPALSVLLPSGTTWRSTDLARQHRNKHHTSQDNANVHIHKPTHTQHTHTKDTDTHKHTTSNTNHTHRRNIHMHTHTQTHTHTHMTFTYHNVHTTLGINVHMHTHTHTYTLQRNKTGGHTCKNSKTRRTQHDKTQHIHNTSHYKDKPTKQKMNEKEQK